jgi:hypothetical protein
VLWPVWARWPLGLVRGRVGLAAMTIAVFAGTFGPYAPWEVVGTDDTTLT